TKLLSGGYRFDGQEIASFDDQAKAELRQIIRQAKSKDISSYCICGVFSPSCYEQELQAAEVIKSEMNALDAKEYYITLSHQIGGLGLFERENASILNSCLRPLANYTIPAFQYAIQKIGIRCPLYLTQNDGTLMSAEKCMSMPILTFSSGPTNSMIGASLLSSIKNGIVIDIGGTSTDIGFIVNGRPRLRTLNAELAEIRVNFSMPDIISYPLGGGTIIKVRNNDQVSVGPESVGYELDTKAMVFGGDVMTTTDIVIAAGLEKEIGRKSIVISPDIISKSLSHISSIIATGVDRMKTSAEPVPVIICGGGSILVHGDSIEGASKIIRPSHFDVCNAVGAAICCVSGCVETIADLPPSCVDGRNLCDEELARLTSSAVEQCISNGAKPHTVQIAQIEQIPLAYFPGHRHRIQIKAIGELDINRLALTNNETEENRSPVPNAPKSSLPTSNMTSLSMNMVNKVPKFDENGAWLLDAIDIEYIAYGTGILGILDF
ncbi:unnamed protein product, partial [Didymodactylos carnosus]